MTRPAEIDTLVIGAGVVGLACARAAGLAGREVVVVDRHPAFGMETSSRNSEVVHAGIYYPAGTLKARLCVAGRDALYAYARDRGIGFRRCGKLIIAQGPSAAADLAAIAHRAQAAGAGELRMLSKVDVRAIEEHVLADAGLFSPRTGIIDSHALMLHYLADIEQCGGVFVPHTGVAAIRSEAGVFVVTLDDGNAVTAAHVINAGGLHSGAVAQSIEPLGEAFKPTIRYARGSYFRPEKSPPFQHLVYPLPTNASLGVHATLDIAGRVRFGPDVQWTDRPDDYSLDESGAEQFAAAIREYWPGVDDTRLVADYVGIRPKLVGPDDQPADFRVDGPADHGVANLVCLHGIESPGLTSSLALGELVARRLSEPPLAKPTASARRGAASQIEPMK
jgi:L-2-hydroxyglutarate oxidase LhgO